MRYDIELSRVAEAALNQIWDESRTRWLLEETLDSLDERLSKNPASAGESRDRDTRLLVLNVLGVLFAVDEDEHMVRIINLWLIKQRP